MSGDQHHKSKRVRYDVVFVPRDDAGESKSLRFAPWQFYLLITGSLVFIVAAVLALLVYTPIGALVPIENPGLVNKVQQGSDFVERADDGRLAGVDPVT